MRQLSRKSGTLLPKLVAVAVLIVICQSLLYATSGSEGTAARGATNQVAYPTAGGSKQPILKELVPVLYVTLGFVLGLLGTIFTEYIQKRRRKTEFRAGALADLKQALAVLHAYAFSLNSKLDKDRLRFLFQLVAEFDLLNKAEQFVQDSPFMDLLEKVESQSDEVLDALASHHNQKVAQKVFSDIFSSIKTVRCPFIESNMSAIALLQLLERGSLLNMLRTISVINEQISRLDFIFEKTYDATLSDENRERLKINYERGRQFIADWSYKATQEIAKFLRKKYPSCKNRPCL
jgi:hypothetical protein